MQIPLSFVHDIWTDKTWQNIVKRYEGWSGCYVGVAAPGLTCRLGSTGIRLAGSRAASRLVCGFGVEQCSSGWRPKTRRCVFMLFGGFVSCGWQLSSLVRFFGFVFLINKTLYSLYGFLIRFFLINGVISSIYPIRIVDTATFTHVKLTLLVSALWTWFASMDKSEEPDMSANLSACKTDGTVASNCRHFWLGFLQYNCPRYIPLWTNSFPRHRSGF